MKHLSFYLITGVVAVTTFFSCNQSEEIIPDVQQTKDIQEDELIERNILNLSSDDAYKLAKKFAKDEYDGGSRTASAISVKDIQIVTSESGTPLMYVVNYADNKGYTIISASKNYTPVLAYSDEGYMDVQGNNFIDNPFFDEYKSRINSVINLESDSLRQRYAIDWSFYEKVPTMVESRTYSNAEIQQKLAEASTYYRNQGYEVHSLSAAPYLIPAANGQTAEQRATGFVNDICMHTSPQYDCMDVTLLLINRYETSYGPLISTSWHQYAPYCTDASNGYAGCWTIATTQLMKYHKWPNSFNWNNIRDTLKTPLSQDETNLMNLRKEMEPIYDPIEGTKISIYKAEAMLRNHGYSTTIEKYPGYKSVASEIINNRPVLMIGEESGNTLGHAWICDGYKYSSVQYAAYMIDRDYNEYTFFSGMTDHYLTEYLHMNMGWTQSNNKIWCYYDSVLNFTQGRHIMKVQPNK